MNSVKIVLIPSIDQVSNLNILNFFQPMLVQFQLNLNTNTDHVNSLNEFSSLQTFV